MNKEQVLKAIEQKEFPEEVIGKGKVAVIMTQDWCPQWKAMEEWIDEIEDIDVHIICYDKEDYFDEFKNFKEEAFGNEQIPYIRYYKDGKLVNESNYITKGSFIKAFEE